MLISVVIPTCNRKEIVGFAISSALNQTHREVEVIVVDDGSTDGTADYVRRRFGESVLYLAKENGGVSSARNLGIRHSSGGLIAFLDSDDEWLPHKLEKQWSFLRDRPDFGMVLCDCIFIDADRNAVEPSRRRKQLPRDGFILDDVLLSPSLIPSSVLVKREVLEDVGFFDEGIRTAEDLDLHLRIAGTYKIGLVAEPLFNCMMGHEGLSRESRTYDDHVFVIDRFVKAHRTAAALPYRQALLQTYLAAANGKFWLHEWGAGIGYACKATALVGSLEESVAVGKMWAKGLKHAIKGLAGRRPIW